MSYQIKFSKVAIKQLKNLPVNIKERIDNKILELSIEPRPNGVKKLKNTENGYRIKVGSYRILYDIFDDVLLITVVKVGHRKDIYKDES